jgi:hypothetical protein
MSPKHTMQALIYRTCSSCGGSIWSWAQALKITSRSGPDKGMTTGFRLVRRLGPAQALVEMK